MLQAYLAKESSLKTLVYHTDALLAPHSSFGIGGHCDYFVTPLTEEALVALIHFLKINQIRYIVIGNATNILFDDTGFRGCVISTKRIKHIAVEGTTVEVSCGYSLIALSALASELELSGLEFACSIPATVGGAIYMNAGAYGGEMKNIVVSCRYLAKDGSIHITTEHGFSYRHSRYQDSGDILLSCTLQLTRAPKESILSTMAENKTKREASQPIKEKSAGSVFRREEDIIPAKLIDLAGLKGFTIGGASVSEKHAGFIVNRGSATARDVLDLIEYVRCRIREEFGVTLSCEIRFIPET